MKRSERRPLTLVLGAMPSEVVAIDSALSGAKPGELSGYAYLRGKLAGRPVVVAYTGVGITNAAMTTALFLHHFRPSELVYTGSGARLDPKLRTGDVVIGGKVAHHNAGNLTPRGMVYRKVRGPRKGVMTPFEFAPDPRLLRAARAAARSFAPKALSLGGRDYETIVKVGKICSGDMFGVTPAKIADIRRKLGSDLIEMEGSAAAQVCWQLGVPHIVIRSGSNRAQPDPGEDYRALGQIAAHQAARFTMHLVKWMARA